MTLAAIFLAGMICTLSPATTSRQDAPQPTPAAAPSDAPAKQDQSTAPAAQSPPAPSQAPSAGAKNAKPTPSQTHSTTTTRSHHKKRVLPPCDSTPAAGQVTAGSKPAPADAVPSGSPASSKATSPCTPSKVVVRQGGTSEPSIQLAGGHADQTAQQRDAANQILQSADTNLKKVSGRQLSADQQDMVNQIRQFMAQSKTAIDVGDLERAHTLAWKAQVLSEELVKPETK